MPELPEVETVVRTLEHLIKDKEVESIQVLYAKILEMGQDQFCAKMPHQHFREFKRRGKYILFEMDDFTLVCHLRMEGKFYFKQQADDYDKHTHMMIYFTDGTRLDYHDTRKFGRMEFMPKKANYDEFKALGPEPFSEQFNEAYIKTKTATKKTALKQFLLDQSFVAGIGNIYADEICFAMQMHPLTPVSSLTKPKRIQLIETIRMILNRAIQAGGSTIRSYTSSLGVNGLFQLQIEVYGQKGKPCPRCGTPIERMIVAQRGTCFCPVCQRKR